MMYTMATPNIDTSVPTCNRFYYKYIMVFFRLTFLFRLGIRNVKCLWCSNVDSYPAQLGDRATFRAIGEGRGNAKEICRKFAPHLKNKLISNAFIIYVDIQQNVRSKK